MIFRTLHIFFLGMFVFLIFQLGQDDSASIDLTQLPLGDDRLSDEP